MSYKTDLHVHSKDISRCSNCPAEIIVEKYVKEGFDSIVLTNHFDPDLINHSPEKTFSSSVDFFLDGFKKLQVAAEGKLNVILGMEVRFRENMNDYLVYGVTEEFLRSIDDLTSVGIRKYSEKVREAGFMMVHAHPFRFGMTVTNPAYFDGIEVQNGHLYHNSNNEMAHLWAEKYNLIKTSGSDHHDITQPVTGGIITDEPVRDSETLLRVLRSGSYTLIEELDATRKRIHEAEEEKRRKEAEAKAEAGYNK